VPVPFVEQALGQPHPVERRHGAVLEQAGAGPRDQLLTRELVDDDAGHLPGVQQVAQRQPGRARAQDDDAGVALVRHSLAPPATATGCGRSWSSGSTYMGGRSGFAGPIDHSVVPAPFTSGGTVPTG
jgi:hypothetical protein